MNRCGFGPCGGRFVGGGGGAGWLAVMDSIALWILAVAAVLFLLGLRRRSRSWGRNAQGVPFGPRGPRGPVPGWPPAPFAPAHQPQAEANLAERFSRGEITADEYRTAIAVLRGQSPFPPGPATSTQPEPPAAPTDPVV